MNTHSRTHRNVAWSVAISMAEILNQLSGAYPLPFQRDHAQATGLGWLYSLATTALSGPNLVVLIRCLDLCRMWQLWDHHLGTVFIR